MRKWSLITIVLNSTDIIIALIYDLKQAVDLDPTTNEKLHGDLWKKLLNKIEMKVELWVIYSISIF